jgi:hypothetical protein
MAGDKDLSEILTELTNFLTANVRAYAGDISSNTNYWFDLATFFQQGRTFTGQAHSGSYEATWSSGVTFNANNGTVQEVVMTNSGTIAISNDLPGTYLLRIEIDSALSPTPTFDASLGTELTNSTVPFDNSDNAVNIITVVHWDSGVKEYTISN